MALDLILALKDIFATEDVNIDGFLRKLIDVLTVGVTIWQGKATKEQIQCDL